MSVSQQNACISIRRASGLANFIVAFGGAAVLGKAIGVVDLSFIQLGSLVAFFFGTVFGLIFLLKIKSAASDLYVGVCGAISSLVLLVIWSVFSKEGSVSGVVGGFFFLVLCVRFGFWFLSRILRSDRVSATNKESIPLIEGLFHSGTIVSLLMVASGFAFDVLRTVLLVDIVAQALGFLIDRRCAALGSAAQPAGHSTTEQAPAQAHWHRALNAPTMALCALTILIQVHVFHLAQFAPASVMPAIIAVFYGGLAGAGLLSSYCVMTSSFAGGLGYLTFSRVLPKQLALAWVLVATLLAYVLFQYGLGVQHLALMLVSAAVASFLYELFSLGLIDRIAALSAQYDVGRGVAKAFGYMALTSCIAMFILRLYQTSIVHVLYVSIGLSLFVLWSTRGSLEKIDY